MPILAQLCVIFGICLAAEGIAAVLPFVFPSSVLAMVILLILLVLKVLKPGQLKETSDFMLSHMTLCFVPVVTGLMTYMDVLLGNFWAIVLISLLTTPLVFFVTGKVVQLTMRWLRRREEKKNA